MRIFGFVLSAAVLHVVVFAISPDSKHQKDDEFLVGVTLVQRQMDPLAAADAPVKGQEHLSADSPDHPLADLPGMVNVAAQQELLDEPVVQDPVDLNPGIVEPDEQLPVIAEEPGVRSVQRPRQQQPSFEPVENAPPDQRLLVPPAQTKPPTADRPETVPVRQRSEAGQGRMTQVQSQAVDGVPPAREPIVDQVTAQPRYGYHPAPAYPGIARRRGWEGTVEFNVRVLKNGDVAEVTLQKSSGYKSLDDAARRAITRWSFTPASRGGTVIETWVVVPVHFVLDAQTRSR